MLASKYGHTEIVKCLIDAKAQIDLQQDVSIVRTARYLQIWGENMPSFNDLHFNEQKLTEVTFMLWYSY